MLRQFQLLQGDLVGPGTRQWLQGAPLCSRTRNLGLGGACEILRQWLQGLVMGHWLQDAPPSTLAWPELYDGPLAAGRSFFTALAWSAAMAAKLGATEDRLFLI